MFFFFFLDQPRASIQPCFKARLYAVALESKLQWSRQAGALCQKKNLHYQRAGRLISLSVWPAAVYASIKVTQYGSAFSWWGFGLLKTLLLLAEVQHAGKSFVCVNVWLPSKQMDFKLMQFASNVLFCFVSSDPQCLGISAHNGFLQAQSLLVPKLWPCEKKTFGLRSTFFYNFPCLNKYTRMRGFIWFCDHKLPTIKLLGLKTLN